MPHIPARATVYPCCRKADDEDRLITIEDRPKHVLVKKCPNCGRRHFRAFVQGLKPTAEPGEVWLGAPK